MFVGDIPENPLRIAVALDGNLLDISGALAMALITTDPTGDVSEQVAEFTTDGTDSLLEAPYPTFDAPGIWRFRARLDLPGYGLRHTAMFKLDVLP